MPNIQIIFEALNVRIRLQMEIYTLYPVIPFLVWIDAFEPRLVLFVTRLVVHVTHVKILQQVIHLAHCEFFSVVLVIECQVSNSTAALKGRRYRSDVQLETIANQRTCPCLAKCHTILAVTT